jgi:hypothetical protein
MERKLPILSKEVVEKFLNPLEREIYYLLLAQEDKKKENK